MQTPALPFYLGCPVWSCDGWADNVYPSRTAKRDFLTWYSRMFNCVEGNSSFYATPTREQAARWASQAATGFRFCFKFPRSISHDRMLVSAELETREFLEALEVLVGQKVAGPAFLQLGPEFGPSRFAVLRKYLEGLPREFEWAVEVRHLDWFDRGQHESNLNTLLQDLNIDRTLFDSRALFQCDASDDSERQSQSRKPRSPPRQTVTGRSPMLRLVGRNNLELSANVIAQWSKIVAGWLKNGLTPYIFAHTPNDQFAPEMARLFEQSVRNHVGELAREWPEIPRLPAKPRQLDLL